MMTPALSPTACPVCHEKESEPRFVASDPLSDDAFQLVTCAGCGLTYVNPRPVGEQLDAQFIVVRRQRSEGQPLAIEIQIHCR